MLLEQMNEKHTFFRGERTPVLKDGNPVHVVMEQAVPPMQDCFFFSLSYRGATNTAAEVSSG